MQINGSMEVSQERGLVGTATPGQWVMDGWQMQYAGTGNITMAQFSVPSLVPGFTNWLIMTIGTAQATINAADYYMLWHKIEGYRIARLGWGTASAKPITIGFWTSHNKTGTYSVTVRNGATNRGYAATYTQTAANVPQYQVVTIPGDTTGIWTVDNSTGLTLTFAVAMGSSNTASAANTWIATPCAAAPGQVNSVSTTSDIFRITGVVVLPGIEAPTAAQSPLIMRPYDQELLTCQRYFQSIPGVLSAGNVSASQLIYNQFPLSTTMRAAPTFTPITPSYSNGSGLSSSAQTTSSYTLVHTGTTAGLSYVSIATVNLDARL
jgi:hypothetical protein